MRLWSAASALQSHSFPLWRLAFSPRERGVLFSLEFLSKTHVHSETPFINHVGLGSLIVSPAGYYYPFLVLLVLLP